MDANSFASVSREEFHAFHSIDRKLYSRLIRNLGRNPAQSMQVVAVWLWLEKTGYCHHLVSKLLEWPDFMINAIADETVTCLKHCVFIEYDDDDDEEEMMMMPPPFSSAANATKSIPSLQSLTKGAISVGFFKEHRTAVMRGVSKVVDEVCVRAFDDIFPSTSSYIINGGGGNNYGDEIRQGLGDTVNWPPLPSTSPMYYSGAGQMTGSNSNSDIINGEERTSGVNGNNIPAEERTIFLTFSKGYPVSRNEIKDFLTRIYGDDVIEAIHMQEVNNGTEQSLYARLVLRSPSSVQVVLEGNKTAKWNINKKHVRARKFVPNNLPSARKSLSPPSSFQSTSPPTAKY